MRCSICIFTIPALLSQEMFSTSVNGRSLTATGAQRKTFPLLPVSLLEADLVETDLPDADSLQLAELSEAMAVHSGADIASDLSMKTVLPFAMRKLPILSNALAMRSG